MTKLFENVQILRQANKIRSIRELETLAGITQDTIKNWKDHLPGCEPVMKLANYFTVSTDFLLGLTSIPNVEKIQNMPNLGKILCVAEALDLDDCSTEIIIKMMYVLNETRKGD